MENFIGVFTAIVTPFTKGGAIDYDALQFLIDYQIKNEISGIVFLGTTGENPTITDGERSVLLKHVNQYVDKRVPTIAGVGSNSTEVALQYALEAQELGFDGLLQVVPYYNKPTQKGLIAHFSFLADGTNIPTIMYNVPSRTGTDMSIETTIELAQHEKIVGVKEASGNIAKIRSIIQQAPEGFSILSGDDHLALDVVTSGGHGVVSVLSNLLPYEMKHMISAGLNGRNEEAQSYHSQLLDLYTLCFIETNPQPLKTLLAEEGMIEESFRLPMTTMQPANKKALLKKWCTIKEKYSLDSLLQKPITL